MQYSPHNKCEERDVEILCIHVDDIVSTRDDIVATLKLKRYLWTVLEMEEFMKSKYFMGIEGSKLSKSTFLSHRTYAITVTWNYKILGQKPPDTPVEVRPEIFADDGNLLKYLSVLQRSQVNSS